MTEIKFPVANVSIKSWDKNEDYLLYILEDPYIYRTDKTLYHKYFFYNSFVDSNGNVFKITDRILPNKIKQFLSFIPNFCKVELVFEKTGENMTKEEIRTHILAQLEKLDYEQKNEWINSVKNAKTIEEIIFS